MKQGCLARNEAVSRGTTDWIQRSALGRDVAGLRLRSQDAKSMQEFLALDEMQQSQMKINDWMQGCPAVGVS